MSEPAVNELAGGASAVPAGSVPTDTTVAV